MNSIGLISRRHTVLGTPADKFWQRNLLDAGARRYGGILETLVEEKGFADQFVDQLRKHEETPEIPGASGIQTGLFLRS